MNFDKAINILLQKITHKITSGEALQYAQAISNLVHAEDRLEELNKPTHTNETIS